MRLSFANKTVTILRPGTTLEWGQEVISWDDVTEIEVTGCTDYALSGVEQVQGVDVVAGCRQLFMPAGTDVRGTDRIRRFGQTWEIIGEPALQESPTGRISNVEVLLKRWDGKK